MINSRALRPFTIAIPQADVDDCRIDWLRGASRRTGSQIPIHRRC
jgi:hypothetical protein